jgi:hypothetical protein
MKGDERGGKCNRRERSEIPMLIINLKGRDFLS